jgi:formate hydrogenlyase subunit 6/NADH:ubiquinone oxidoreductase subunit I
MVVCLTIWAIHLITRPRFVARYQDSPHTTSALWAFAITFIVLEIFRTLLPIQLILIERFFPGFGILEVALWAIYAATMTNLILQDGSKKWRRVIWSLFSVIFFIQFALGLGFDSRFLQMGTIHVPWPTLIIGGPLYRGGVFFMLFLFLTTVVLAGPAWCSYLCYIGSWDLNLACLAKSPSSGTLSSWPRAVALMLTIIVALALRLIGFSLAFISGVLAASILISFVVMLYSTKIGKMVHCSTFCPIGLIATIVGKINPIRIRLSTNCTGCGACSDACPNGALSKEQIEKKSPGITCTLCGDCLGACTHGALEYQTPYLNASQTRSLFVTIVVTLHSLFMAIARI